MFNSLPRPQGSVILSSQLSQPRLTEGDEDVLHTAERVAKFAASIREGHLLGHGPGAIDDLCSPEFNTQAVAVSARTIPWSYLTALGERFVETATYMVTRGGPPSHVTEWLCVVNYLHTAGGAMLIRSPKGTTPATDVDLREHMPSVMQFELLAGLASCSGVKTLREAGEAVSTTLASSLAGDPPNPLSPDDIQLVQLLSSGQRISDLSAVLGYSTRTIHRRLTRIWESLGVQSRSEGIAIAAARGWLDQEGV